MNEGIFITILNMSFTGTIVALIVMAARLVMKRLPGRYSYLLWAAVGIRLLCPFIWETDFSLLPVKPEPIAREIVYDTTPVLDSGVYILDGPVNYGLSQAALPKPSDPVNPVQIWLEIGSWIWIAGCAVFILINFILYGRLRRKLRTAVLLKGIKEEGKKDPDIYETDRISSPIAAGFIRPAIYVPFSMEKEDLGYVVLHEKVHIKRKDYLIKLIGFFALAVHWFNPFIWISYFLMCEDMEKACDEKVLDLSGEGSRIGYSETLLRFAVKENRLFLPLTFGESHTKSRIKNILKYKKTAPLAGVLITAVVLLAGCTLATDPKETAEAISIIGGADGPTSIFLAGKTDEEEEDVPYDPVDLSTLSGAVLDKERTQISLDYASRDQGQLIFHGPWGVFVFENTDGKWQMAHSIDMKKVDSSYMEEGKVTQVIPAGSGIFIGNQESGEGKENVYYYEFNSRKLYLNKDLGDFLDMFWSIWQEGKTDAGPDQKIYLREDETAAALGIPYDYGYYFMEDGHIGLLCSYTDRAADLWFADVDQENKTMTQTYLFQGDGTEQGYSGNIQ